MTSAKYNDEMYYIRWLNVLLIMFIKLCCTVLQCVSHVLPLYYIQWRNVLYTMTKCTICYDYTSALQCVSHVFPLLHTMLTKPTFEKFWQLWLSPSACTVLHAVCFSCVAFVQHTMTTKLTVEKFWQLWSSQSGIVCIGLFVLSVIGIMRQVINI